jgi:uncharacterized protein YbcI
MDHSNPTITEQIAQAALAFEIQRTGHRPQSAKVVLSQDTLVIMLYGALSPAEIALAQSPQGAAFSPPIIQQLLPLVAAGDRENRRR